MDPTQAYPPPTSQKKISVFTTPRPNATQPSFVLPCTISTIPAAPKLRTMFRYSSVLIVSPFHIPNAYGRGASHWLRPNMVWLPPRKTNSAAIALVISRTINCSSSSNSLLRQIHKPPITTPAASKTAAQPDRTATIPRSWICRSVSVAMGRSASAEIATFSANFSITLSIPSTIVSLPDKVAFTSHFPQLTGLCRTHKSPVAVAFASLSHLLSPLLIHHSKGLLLVQDREKIEVYIQ